MVNLRYVFRVSLLALGAVLSQAVFAHDVSAHDHAALDSPMQKQWAARLRAATGSTASVAADEAGVLWRARMEAGHVLIDQSKDGGAGFTDEVRVNATPEAILADGQNRPFVVAGGGVLAVVWAQALPKLHAGHIRFSRSLDGGKTFSTPVTINDDLQEIGHSFPMMALGANGRLVIAWLDGRVRAAAGKQGKSSQGSALYFVVSEDRGARFSPNRKLADPTCECCRIALSIAPDGMPVAFWRHIFGTQTRDFALASLTENSAVLRASEDHWEITACPHHGGDLSIDETGRRHLAWFTGVTPGAGLYYRYFDAVAGSPPLVFGNPANQAGHPAVFARQGRVSLVWREYDGTQYRLWHQHSSDRGRSWSPASALASTDKPADLPLFVVGAQTPLLYWHVDGVTRIFDLARLP